MKQILTVILLLCAVVAKAQDNLYLRKGDVLEVKVKKVTDNTIYYTAPGGGPQRFIRKDAVERIVYKSGREVAFRDPAVARARRQAIPAYHMLTISPHFFFFSDVAGLGLAVDYERYFGERRALSVHVPVQIGYGSSQQTDIDGNTLRYPYLEVVPFLTAPGVRYHPVRPGRRADYATGLSLAIGNMNGTTVYEHGFGTNTDASGLFCAALMDNDLNLTSRRKVVFGIHTAFGPILSEVATGSWMVQIGLKIGRRF